MEGDLSRKSPGPWKVQQRIIWILNPETGVEEDKLVELANLDFDVVRIWSGRYICTEADFLVAP